MSKPTPGPWRLKEMQAGRRLEIRSERTNEQVALATLIPNGRERTHLYNALLIAAAPEMLKALKKMTGFHQSELDDNPDHPYSAHAQSEIEKAWDVIAKAEGK